MGGLLLLLHLSGLDVGILLVEGEGERERKRGREGEGEQYV